MKGKGLERFQLLAASIAGTRVTFATDPESVDHRAWTEGSTVILPLGVTDEAQWRDSVVVQASLIAVGSLKASVVMRMVGRPSVRARYLTLEAARAISVLGDNVPAAITRRIADVYCGAITSSAEQSYSRAIRDERIPAAPHWLGTIKPSRILRNSMNPTGQAASGQDMKQHGEQDMLADTDDEQESERSRIREILSLPFRNSLSQASSKFFEASRSSSDDDGSGTQELKAGGGRVGRVSRRGRPTALSADVGAISMESPVGRTYPEWDVYTHAYRLGHCTVTHFDPAPGTQDGALDDGYDPRLRHSLARLGVSCERHRRRYDGDELDVTAMMGFAVDRLVGRIPDARIFELKRTTAHELGVVVLLDSTGSTADSDWGTSVFDDQRRLAAKLIAAFDELGDRVAAYGFQSWGARAVQFLRVKDFDDRYDPEAQRRLATLEPGGFTRLGAAIRHATHLLQMASGVPKKLLIIVGDGLPYDHAYEGHYAQEDSRNALSEALAAGVGCVCVSVQTATDAEVLERVWGHVPCLKLDQLDDLPDKVVPLLKRALGEAVAIGQHANR